MAKRKAARAKTPKRPKLMPAGTPDYMAGAWASCLSWAIGKDEMRADFEKETGRHWSPPRSGLDRAIDEATGADRAYIEAFITWFNEHVWGNEPIEDVRDRPSPDAGAKT
jgi:hypothetical protein